VDKEQASGELASPFSIESSFGAFANIIHILNARAERIFFLSYAILPQKEMENMKGEIMGILNNLEKVKYDLLRCYFSQSAG
jgi:hypothetical protein